MPGGGLRPASEAMSIAELSEADEGRFVPILPRVNVVKIGGQSLIDRGRSAVFPVIEELGANAPEHQLIIGVGAGTRARHVYDLGSKLGLPTGLLATLGSGVSEQNSLMIAALMAKYDAVRLSKSEFSQLPMCLAAGSPVVVTGSPPYHWWEPPPSVGRLPDYRTDSGVYLIAAAKPPPFSRSSAVATRRGSPKTSSPPCWDHRSTSPTPDFSPCQREERASRPFRRYLPPLPLRPKRATMARTAPPV